MISLQRYNMFLTRANVVVFFSVFYCIIFYLQSTLDTFLWLVYTIMQVVFGGIFCVYRRKVVPLHSQYYNISRIDG